MKSKYENTFSVIIPCYNSENFISNAIQSVLNQTNEVEELIIVDDGSSDNSVKVIKDLFTKNRSRKTNFIIIKNSHQGPGAARNAGIKKASSEWICFLDSDDYWEENKIEVVEKYIKKNKNINFLCHNEYVIKLNGVKKFSNYSKFYKYEIPLFDQIYYRNYFSTSAIVCKKKLLENNFFNTNLMSAQDYELWIRASNKINLFFVPEVLGYYVERKGNITSGNLYNRMINEVLIANMYKQKAGLKLFMLRLTRIYISYIYYFIKRLIF